MADPAGPAQRSGWTTSLNLMDGIRANDPAAWERFTRLYGALFDHWFRLAGVPKGDWADLRQEAFLAVARGLPGYRHTPGRGAFRGWLRVIVRNKLIDHSRRQFPASDMQAVLDQAAAPGECEEPPGEYRLLLRRALDLIRTDFEPATWQAFWMVAVEDRQPAEAATELGLTLNAVYLAKARVVRRLRQEFADFLDDAPPPRPPD